MRFSQPVSDQQCAKNVLENYKSVRRQQNIQHSFGALVKWCAATLMRRSLQSVMRTKVTTRGKKIKHHKGQSHVVHLLLVQEQKLHLNFYIMQVNFGFTLRKYKNN